MSLFDIKTDTGKPVTLWALLVHKANSLESVWTRLIPLETRAKDNTVYRIEGLGTNAFALVDTMARVATCTLDFI